jgi:hypothetical protein
LAYIYYLCQTYNFDILKNNKQIFTPKEKTEKKKAILTTDTSQQSTISPEGWRSHYACGVGGIR